MGGTAPPEAADQPSTASPLNLLGYPIGAAQDARYKPMMVFAVNQDGALTHISAAANGKACNCRCRCCAQPVLARQGQEREHHFAHVASRFDSRCEAAETQVHLLAKWVFDCRRELRLPAWAGYGSRLVLFDHVDVEAEFQGLRIDAAASKGERSLLVEFAVTHRVSPAKAKRLTDQRVSAIEIDLSGFRYADNDTLLEALVTAAPRRWICHAENPNVVLPMSEPRSMDVGPRSARPLDATSAPASLPSPQTMAVMREPFRTRQGRLLVPKGVS